MPTAAQRKNLLKLAAYLESLPADYTHFDMTDYADHRGDCELPMPVDKFAAKKPRQFLANCGTVACAIGHGPAAGIRLLPRELVGGMAHGVRWYDYAGRAFASQDYAGDVEIFDFLFSSDWSYSDNHHYGAAARIRYFLATGRAFCANDDNVTREYAPYRKGSRSATRRAIEQVSA